MAPEEGYPEVMACLCNQSDRLNDRLLEGVAQRSLEKLGPRSPTLHPLISGFSGEGHAFSLGFALQV
eukprot:2769779-Amphidinium_carterae.1